MALKKQRLFVEIADLIEEYHEVLHRQLEST